METILTQDFLSPPHIVRVIIDRHRKNGILSTAAHKIGQS